MADEAKGSKSWYEVLAMLTPLILGLGVTGVAAYFSYQLNARQLEANRDNSFQQMQINQLTLLDRFRPQLLSEVPAEREFAYAAFTLLGQDKLALKIMTLKDDSAGRAVAASILQSGNEAARAEAASTLAAVKPRVLVHYGDSLQKDKAQELVALLKQGGYSAPGAENVAGRAKLPVTTNVRYFNDADKATADAIAQMLVKQGFKDARSYRVRQFEVSPGSLEIWLALAPPTT